MDATADQALPLLDRSASTSPEPRRPDSGPPAGRKSEDTASTLSLLDDDDAESGERPTASRAVEDDVIPETSVLGRHLGWGSAFIIIISRVIGSGIFATPGLVVKAVGSVGLALTLWVVGAVIAWLAMAIFLEYGCMLPRSGGKAFYPVRVRGIC
jgi:amino acid permease